MCHFFNNILMITDDQVTTYNLFKKLAQLDKVVQYLNVHLVERSYQKETIRSRYNQAEDEIFSNHEKKMNEFQRELDMDIDYDSAEKLYHGKYDIVLTGFLEASKSKREDLNQFTQNFEDIVNTLKEQLMNYTKEMEYEINFLTKEITEANTRAVSQVKKLEFDNRKELSNLDKESVTKYRKKESELDEQIKKIKQEYAKQMQEVRDEFKKLPKPGSVLDVKKMRNWKLKLSNMREALQKAKSDADFHMQNFEEMMKNIKPQKEEKEQKEEKPKKHKKSPQEELKNLENILETETKNMDTEKKNMLKKIEENKKSFEANMTLLSNELTALLHSNKTNLSEKMKDLTVSNKTQELSLEDFKKQRKQDELTTKAKNDKLDQEVQKKLSEFTHDINIQKQAIKEDLDRAREDAKDEKSIMERMIKSEDERYNTTRKTLIIKHKDVVRKKEKEIEETNTLVFNFRKAQQELKMLVSQLDSLQKIMQTTLSTYDSQEQEETTQIKLTFEKITNNDNAKHNEEYNAKTRFAQKSFSKLDESNEETYRKREVRFNNENEEYYENLKNEFSEETKRIKQEMEENYQKELEMLQKELDEYENYTPPSTESLENEVNAIDNEKEMKQKEKDGEKDDLVSKFNTEYENEVFRHENYLLSLLRQTNRNENIDDTLNCMRNNAMIVLKELEGDYTTKNETLKKLRSLPSPIIQSAEDCLEVQQLREKIAELQALKKRKIQEAEEESKRMIQELEDEINNEKNSIQNKKDQIDKDNEEIETKLHELFASETERRTQSRTNSEKNESKLVEIMKIREKSLRERLQKEAEDAEKALEEGKKQLTQDEEDRKGKADEQWEKLMKQLDEETKKCDTEIKEMKKNRVYSHPELDEKLKNATKLRDEWKDKYNNKPMRDKEKFILENLIQLLHQKTSYLIIIGRDLLSYRARLLQQEDEVNGRFGNDPVIGIMRGSVNAQRPMTAGPSVTNRNSKKLPKLAATIKFV